MKRSFIFIALCALLCTAFAQQSAPSGIRPMTGQLTFTLTPNFESVCTSHFDEKAYGNVNRTQWSLTYESAIRGDSVDSSTFTITLKRPTERHLQIAYDRRSQISGLKLDPDIEGRPNENSPWTDANGTFYFKTPEEPDSDKDKDTAVLYLLAHLKRSSYALNALNNPLTQGSQVVLDLCTDRNLKQSEGGFKVIGLTKIRGREAVVISGRQFVSCKPPDGDYQMSVVGWSAFDVDSGLISAQSTLAITTHADQRLNTESIESRECNISGQSLSNATRLPPTNNSNSIEQKLINLKSLLNQNLITNDQFEKKREELLKGF